MAEIKEHNVQKITQFCQIWDVLCIVNDPSNKAAAICIDWSENAKLLQSHHENSSYYHDIQISVNNMVAYQANKSTACVGSLSDNTNHQNAAVWGSLKLIINAINLDVDKLYI